jgi:hypothetical protein
MLRTEVAQPVADEQDSTSTMSASGCVLCVLLLVSSAASDEAETAELALELLSKLQPHFRLTDVEKCT